MREQTHTGRGMLALAIASIITAFMSAQTPDGGLPRRPALGVALGPNERGVVVTAVTPGSAAEAGGITTGDVIDAVDGSVVRLPADVIAAVARHGAGDPIRLEIIRAGKPESRDVRLGSSPPGAHRPAVRKHLAQIHLPALEANPPAVRHGHGPVVERVIEIAKAAIGRADGV